MVNYGLTDTTYGLKRAAIFPIRLYALGPCHCMSLSQNRCVLLRDIF